MLNTHMTGSENPATKQRSAAGLWLNTFFLLCEHSFTVTLYLQDVGDDSNRPAVHCFAVGLLCQNFRSWKWEKKYDPYIIDKHWY